MAMGTTTLRTSRCITISPKSGRQGKNPMFSPPFRQYNADASRLNRQTTNQIVHEAERDERALKQSTSEMLRYQTGTNLKRAISEQAKSTGTSLKEPIDAASMELLVLYSRLCPNRIPPREEHISTSDVPSSLIPESQMKSYLLEAQDAWESEVATLSSIDLKQDKERIGAQVQEAIKSVALIQRTLNETSGPRNRAYRGARSLRNRPYPGLGQRGQEMAGHPLRPGPP